MNKMMKIKRFVLRNIVIIVSLFVLLSAYFLLQPRISNNLPFIREYRLSQFIQNSLKNHHISAQEFWELREFYSPGHIQFERPNLTFYSPKIYSQETLVSNKVLLKTILPSTRNWHILYSSSNELIAKENTATFIYFIKPISEMKAANGFFDYIDKDKKLLENKQWYVKTVIQK